jgi:hypothetical protein
LILVRATPLAGGEPARPEPFPTSPFDKLRAPSIVEGPAEWIELIEEGRRAQKEPKDVDSLCIGDNQWASVAKTTTHFKRENSPVCGCIVRGAFQA